MARPLVVLLLALVLLVPAAHAYVGIWNSSPNLQSLVVRNTVVKFNFEVWANDVDEHDVVIDFVATGGATLISASAPSTFHCTFNGPTARCNVTLIPKNTTVYDFFLSVQIPNALEGSNITVTGTITSNSGQKASWPASVVLPKYFLVTNTATAGFGSLAEAIERANVACGELPCEIDFEIAEPPPASGVYTIAPDRALPVVTARRIVIDGRTQTAFSGNTNPAGPEIVINGARAGNAKGLVMAPKDPGDLTIRNVVINGFADAAVVIDGRSAFRPTVTECYIGTDATGTTAVPNLRGIVVNAGGFTTVTYNLISGNRASAVFIWQSEAPIVWRNRIGVAADGVTPLPNGASGVLFGPHTQHGAASENIIQNNRDFGVAVASGAEWIEIRNNSMKGNGQLGIDYNLDLVTPNENDPRRALPDAPVLTSAKFDPVTGKTRITGSFDRRLRPDFNFGFVGVDFYASSVLDAHGMAQGERSIVALSSGESVPEGTFAVIYDGDLRAQYVSATTVRYYPLGKGTPAPNYWESWQATSEMSAPVRVE